MTTLKQLLAKKSLKRNVTSWRLIPPLMPKHEEKNTYFVNRVLALAEHCRAHAKGYIAIRPIDVLAEEGIPSDIVLMSSFHIPLSVIKMENKKRLNGYNSLLSRYARSHHLL